MMVILDLDQTLADTSCAETHRSNRRWDDAYRCIPQFMLYDGVVELIGAIRECDRKVSLVTSSPRPYAERVTRHFGWAFDAVVCFHDTQRRKPYPDPLVRAMELCGVKPQQTLAVGDQSRDTEAARACGVVSVGALWGSLDKDALIASRPDYLFETVFELIKHIKQET